MAGALDELDPDGASPALAVAASIVLYLGSQPHHPPRDPEGLITQAVRMEFGDNLPAAVADWLAGPD